MIWLANIGIWAGVFLACGIYTFLVWWLGFNMGANWLVNEMQRKGVTYCFGPDREDKP